MAQLKDVRWLALFGTPVRNVEPIRALERLEYLDLSNTQVKDVKAIGSLVKLELLYLHACQVSDISALSRPCKSSRFGSDGYPSLRLGAIDGTVSTPKSLSSEHEDCYYFASLQAEKSQRTGSSLYQYQQRRLGSSSASIPKLQHSPATWVIPAVGLPVSRDCKLLKLQCLRRRR